MNMRARDPKINVLRYMELFSACSEKELARVAAVLTAVTIPAGHVLTQEDRREREQCFLIVEGEVAVTRGGVQLATIGAGGLVGEAATLTGERRSATVIALTPLRTFIFDPRTFQPVLDTMPAVRASVLRCLAGRLRSVDAEIAAAR